MQTVTDGANVRFPPPLVYAAGVAIGIAVSRIWKMPTLGLGSNVRDIAAASLILAGVIVAAASVGLFIRKRTAIIPYKPAIALVTSGIYRWSRNPMYLGLALVYLGLALLLNSLPVLVLLPVVLAIIQSQVIVREEAYLERAFGPTYAAYKRQVRMWI
jgi:protein-S-isoprenylcysteine O-methyltransferase Ste14